MPPISRIWQRLQSDALLRHSLLLLVASQAVNATNLLYQWLMIRALPPAEYGSLMAVLGLILSAAVPLEALRAAVARQVARLAADGAGTAALRGAVARWLRGLTAAALLTWIPAFAAERLAEMFGFATPRLVVAALAALSATLFTPALHGALQGVEAFGRLSMAGILYAAARIALGMALVLGWSATALAATAGNVMASALALVAVFLWWRSAASGRTGGPAAAASAAERAEVVFFARALIVLAAFGGLMNADVPMAKLYFPPEAAGVFARAATIARAVVFLPMPIAIAVFPKIIARARDATARRQLERRAWLFTAALIAAATAGAWLISGPLWQFFVGKPPTAGELRLTRQLLLAMAPLGAIYLQVNLLLARGEWRRGLWLVPVFFGYALAVGFWHSTPAAIAAALGCSGLAGLLGLAIPERCRRE